MVNFRVISEHYP